MAHGTEADEATLRQALELHRHLPVICELQRLQRELDRIMVEHMRATLPDSVSQKARQFSTAEALKM